MPDTQQRHKTAGAASPAFAKVAVCDPGAGEAAVAPWPFDSPSRCFSSCPTCASASAMLAFRASFSLRRVSSDAPRDSGPLLEVARARCSPLRLEPSPAADHA